MAGVFPVFGPGYTTPRNGSGTGLAVPYGAAACASSGRNEAPAEARQPTTPANTALRRTIRRILESLSLLIHCYAYQIDGTTFSYLVVFEVRAA